MNIILKNDIIVIHYGGINMKVVVLFKEGYEEVEALGSVDVLRRANIDVDLVGMDSIEVVSSHAIKMTMDKVFDESVYDADVVVLPGGLPGATNLRDDQRVIDLLKDFNDKGKIIAAICAGPISLETAGIINGKNYTCYPGFNEQMPSGIYQDVLVCQDGHIITGRGPAASFELGYAILEALGIDSEPLQKAMQYNYLK